MGGSVAEVSRRFTVKGGTVEGPELGVLGPGHAERIVVDVAFGFGGLPFGVGRVRAGLDTAASVAVRIMGERVVIVAVRVVAGVSTFEAGGAVMVTGTVMSIDRSDGRLVRPNSSVFVLFGLVEFGSGFRAVRMYPVFRLVPALAGRRPVV